LKGILNIETLKDDNKYACPTCDEKQEAEKGSKFGKLPKILMLQLQRFTIDMQTFNRKKLNDEVSFPLILNVNPFLDKDQLKDDVFLNDLISENILSDVKTKMKKNTGYGRVNKNAKKVIKPSGG